MADGQDRLRAAAEAQARDAGVLDLALAQADVGGEAKGPLDRAEQVQQHLDAMAAEVHHGPAARFRLAQEPGARVVGAGVEGLEGLDAGQHRRADLSGGDQRAQPAHDRVVVAVVGHAQADSVGTCGRPHPLAAGHVHRHRLLAEHVFAGLRRRHRVLDVQAHRRGHVDGVRPRDRG